MTEAANRGRYTTPEGSATWEYITTACCALLIFSVGCVAGWTSPSLNILMAPDSPIPLTATDASTCAFVLSVGHLVAPLLTLVLNRFGRKVGLYATGVPMIIGFGLIIVARETLVLFLARFVSGLSMGLGLCFAPIYMGEIASARLRGSLAIVCGAMMSVAILFMFVLVPYLSIRMMACICLIIVTISTLSIWFIPETPYFLAMHGKFDEAESVLEKLRGKTDVTEELNLIKETVRRKHEVTGGSGEGEVRVIRKNNSIFKRLFTVPGNRKAFIINILLSAVVQFGGTTSILSYGHIIFDAMKSGVSGDIFMMILTVLTLFCNIVTGLIIDKVGRRPLVLICGVMSSIFLLTVNIYLYLMEYTAFDVTPYALAASCAMIAALVSVQLGIMPVAIVIQSETMEIDVRALAACLLTISSGIMSSIVLKSYLRLAIVWGFGHCVPFFISFAITSISVIVISKLLTETKGKTLLQIQEDLNS